VVQEIIVNLEMMNDDKNNRRQELGFRSQRKLAGPVEKFSGSFSNDLFFALRCNDLYLIYIPRDFFIVVPKGKRVQRLPRKTVSISKYVPGLPRKTLSISKYVSRLPRNILSIREYVLPLG
jgi:hypothetical protein